MAAVASIQSELRNLGLSSKRHNNELAQSASKSLSILEAASQSYENEQLAIYSLRKYNDFITPFILACSEASAKSCASALQCIQTLATFKGIAPPRLSDLLKALMEAAQLGLGIQLKILQVLPVILHEFASDLSGEEVIELIQVCAALLEGNKVAMVHNAAYATLQQLITGVFDRTNAPLSQHYGATEDKLCHVDVNESVGFDVPSRLRDSLLVLIDLCNFAERIPPKFLKIKELSLTFTLELIELTLSNQADLIHKHEEFAAILRCRVTTLLLRLFSETSEFPIVLRVMRIFYLLLRQHLTILTTESEVVLSTLAQGARQSILWKRALCLEVLQGVLLEVPLLYQIFEKFDAEQGRSNIIGNLTSMFADALSKSHGLMLATDMTAENIERASIKAESDSPITEQPSNDQPAVLSKSCMPNTPVIEMLDRVEAPDVSYQYSYFLIVKCANFMTDDVHKLVSTEVENSSEILTSLASPLLVCLSASMSIAMDNELFRLVVRSVQRFAHAAGIVNNTELRDEFIRLLIQHCHIPEDSKNKPWVVSRCALCIRALFNLGYALGNQLGKSWELIVSVIYGLAQDIGTENSSLESLYGGGDPEYRTINVALRKLLESTTHLNDQALVFLTDALGSTETPFKFTLIKLVAIINSSRFAHSDSGCWQALSNIFLAGVMNEEHSFVASAVLNEIALVIMETAVHENLSPVDLDKSLGMTLKSVCAQVKATNSEVRVSASEHINMLLDKFGAMINESWAYVFDYISSVPGSNDYDLMHSTFRTVELVCSDFLDNLPYPRVLNLTRCLDEFARQEIDLNTSFTSTSLFWSVCDHLMHGSDPNVDMNPDSVHSEEDLMRVASCYDSPSKCFALWLFAVLRLACISGGVAQQQVRTSAIQIFLRLFNAHGSQLPAGVWNIALSLVFPTFLAVNEKIEYAALGELEESRISLIDGLSRIIIQFFVKLNHLTAFGFFLNQWISFLKNSTEFSPKISVAVYKNLALILAADSEKAVPRQAIAEFWLSQNLRPRFAEQNGKATADALTDFVNLFPFISDVVVVSKSLEALSSCAMFPYYTIPSVSSEVYHMSTLQEQATEKLGHLENYKDPAIIAEVLELLNQMSLTVLESELDLSKQNFKGLSLWALQKIVEVINQLESPPPEIVSAVFPKLLTGMNRLLSIGGNPSTPTSVILKLLDMSPSLASYDAQSIIESFQLVLSDADKAPYDANKNEVELADRFITVIRSKDLGIEHWQELLRILKNYSILYERSIHNRKFYEQETTFGSEALQFGTVESPVRIHSSVVSFFCLRKLRELGAEEKNYSCFSRKLFTLRVSCVLNQYVGDCKILGQEPLREIIHEELLFVLQQLIACSDSRSKVEPKITQLVLQSLSRAHRDLLPLFQKIMINAKE